MFQSQLARPQGWPQLHSVRLTSTALVPVLALVIAAQDANRPLVTSSRITVAAFGRMPDGTQIDGYSIRNLRGTSMHVITYGGIITSLRTVDRFGQFDDVVLGFDSLDFYRTDSPYFGAIVGRYANRIARGRFTL